MARRPEGEAGMRSWSLRVDDSSCPQRAASCVRGVGRGVSPELERWEQLVADGFSLAERIQSAMLIAKLQQGGIIDGKQTAA